MSDMKNKKQDK